ncbi:hypothetical protein [Marinobacterium aestuariivivens]|uniref:Uncharacterized protein n=1 Tax=Marinobacterium aestuariivivens TaxID=1698799 RepID=A0ABW1ZV22_9GAMM
MTDEEQEWNGIERRSGKDRRQNPDRREEVRFEPGKPGRRKNKGRRKEDGDPWSKGTV